MPAPENLFSGIAHGNHRITLIDCLFRYAEIYPSVILQSNIGYKVRAVLPYNYSIVNIRNLDIGNPDIIMTNKVFKDMFLNILVRKSS